MTIPPLQTMADAIRVLSMDAVEQAQSGHPGMPMGMADVATVLYTTFLNHDPSTPTWMNRDRFVLSAGHGSMLLYSLLYLTGYPDMTLGEIKNFRQWGSKTPGHPEFGHTVGVETTTGPLGQGFANAVGFAFGEALMATRFPELINHYTYTMVGDGCLMEGISQEALSFAGHHKLCKLIVLFDDNNITIDGSTALSTSDNHLKRFEASGWHVQAINGHDAAAIEEAIRAAQHSDKPSLIACKTVIACGAPTKAGTHHAHGAPLGRAEITQAKLAMGYDDAPFAVPDTVVQEWRATTTRGVAAHKAWQETLAALPKTRQEEFLALISKDLPLEWDQDMAAFKDGIIEAKPKLATRQWSQKTLTALAPHMPTLLGGSADLTGSNNTNAASMKYITPTDHSGNYIHYGIREHAMGAIMNGLALYGGFIPYGGTFLTFSDYCRPAIRLSALMGVRVIYVMTHDSIGLGEDGPTHQPIEHLASLRAMPNLHVFRPCDGIETAECWMLALRSQHTPSVMALTRQGLPTLRVDHENKSAKGAYVLEDTILPHQVTLLATGSEVSLAVDVRNRLEAAGIGASVVSMPCWSLYDAQSAAYKESTMPTDTLRVSIEAGSTIGWRNYVGDRGLAFGLDHFGASAPIHDLYKHFGLTADVIAHTIQQTLQKKG